MATRRGKPERRMDLSTEGKEVIWKPLQMKWRQKEIALWKEELRFFESKMEFEDFTCKSVQGEMLEEANETEKSCAFKTNELCMIAGTSQDDEPTLNFVKEKKLNLNSV